MLSSFRYACFTLFVGAFLNNLTQNIENWILIKCAGKVGDRSSNSQFYFGTDINVAVNPGAANRADVGLFRKKLT